MLSAAITLKQLRTLLSVAEHRSLTAAAEALHQTTPAIHSQIRKLEDLAGRPLLMRERDGAGYVLTASGEAIARAARRIDANLSHAADDLRAISSGFQGHVRLSTVSTAQYFAPLLVRMLRDALPEIDVGLHVGNRREVIAELDQGRADLAVMGRPPRAPLVRSEPLGAHPHGILLPPGHGLAGKDGFDAVELLQETFLVREEGSGTRALMMRYLDRLSEGASPPMIELSSNESIKQAVIAGLGIAFLSLHTARDDLVSGRLVLLRGMGLPVMRQWYLVRPAETIPTAACDQVARAITGFAGAYFPALSGLTG
ncbi:LysR family transcriptional regulator [Roseovarius autotrophicus]|uniref:LysR family transcriptional regulator n=1 Tax=Roseovarius autotrophicus TaxID=2824121 RepID=UPI001B37A62D|nr:LysR family transcriptional regulator [Roseovarius autotrophicus]